MTWKKLTAVLFLLLLANTAYIATFATASIFYMGNVLGHVVLGCLVFLLAIRYLPRPVLGLSALVLLTGLWLTYTGAIRPQQKVLLAHMVLGALAIIAVAWKWPVFRKASVAFAFITAGLALRPQQQERIKNPEVVPLSMEAEGGGPRTPFWPSSSRTNVGGVIPSDFFMDSKLCGECHKQIYDQWNSSVHHFASFNNQFYRKSIEQMQELSGTQGSKWCAGCHDHAVFFNGRFEKPIKDQMDTPEARNGLGCVSCHSISHVDSTMGNGGFTIEYPPLHDLASSRNKYVRALDNFLTYLDPEPHRRTFMKPFMRLDNSEYCSTCHKVHLDKPVNNYRWLRGFNDYDNWQASGVSGQGARSFYYPPKSQTCSDCHMPMVESNDPGARDGKIHSHNFATANTAVAVANKDKRQLDDTVKFLKSGFITVDIFAASPVQDNGTAEMRRRAGEAAPKLNTSFAVGEESEQSSPVFLREVGQVAAPLDKVPTAFKAGETIRLDVVVRTRKIGHFFPGGTVDSFDVWLELIGTDAAGKPVFWSGKVEDDGTGPVEPGAHFYRSYLLDGEGNPINKRNAWQARSALYVRLIPPGAADTVHYRVKIPDDAKGPITFHAKLNYRKFSHYYTQYAYAGKPTGGAAAKNHDSRDYSFVKANIPANVSGEVKGEIPVLPIVTLAEARARINVGSAPSSWQPVVAKADRERWNDWGIGMLLQGDLKGAEFAFTRVTEAEPSYPDGWLNIARALIQEGETDAAKPMLARTLQLAPSLARGHFFTALVQKTEGDYDAAIASLEKVIAQYPRDRVAQNQLARTYFLQRNWRAAIRAAQNVLSVDPEDVQAHYTLMLAWRGVGDNEQAAREQQLFQRFKADEASQAITQNRRLISPEDNNERQQIHDHESIPLGDRTQRAKPSSTTRPEFRSRPSD